MIRHNLFNLIKKKKNLIFNLFKIFLCIVNKKYIIKLKEYYLIIFIIILILNKLIFTIF